MAGLNRAQILGASDMRVMRVEVTEWATNGTTDVYLRRFSIADSNAIALLAPKTSGDIAAGIAFNMRVLVLAVSDESGKQLLSEEDIPALMQRDAQIVKRLVHDALVFNKLVTPEPEDPEKNSQQTTSSASPSG